jgi:hypothetical protein
MISFVPPKNFLCFERPYIGKVAEREWEFVRDFPTAFQKDADANTPMHFNNNTVITERASRQLCTETSRTSRINPVSSVGGTPPMVMHAKIFRPFSFGKPKNVNLDRLNRFAAYRLKTITSGKRFAGQILSASPTVKRNYNLRRRHARIFLSILFFCRNEKNVLSRR